jgi:hypothetical protein
LSGLRSGGSKGALHVVEAGDVQKGENQFRRVKTNLESSTKSEKLRIKNNLKSPMKAEKLVSKGVTNEG